MISFASDTVDCLSYIAQSKFRAREAGQMVLKQYLIPGGTTLTDHCHKGGRQVTMPRHHFMHPQLDEQLPSVHS